MRAKEAVKVERRINKEKAEANAEILGIKQSVQATNGLSTALILVSGVLAFFYSKNI